MALKSQHQDQAIKDSPRTLVCKAERHKLSLKQFRDILKQRWYTLTPLGSFMVKPENIMVSGQGQAKLIDFGMSRFVSDATAGTRLQPLCYKSPEIMLGLPFTGVIDMWSLGCVAAELLTCRMLYPCYTEYDLAGNVRGEPIPPSFLDLLKRMLKLNPDERITPRELLKHPFIYQESQDQPSSSSTVQQPAPCEDPSSSTVQQPAPCEDSSSSSSN
ncbi:hypothetical protein CRUP_022825 [Coryphaenoides rupestris]|nr:hypothetical protein CRUP_022825 [Coryphaenoides rupestris]